MNSNQYTIGICDDEEAFRKKILDEARRLCREQGFPAEFVLFASGEEVVSFERNIDILLLDEELGPVRKKQLYGGDVRRILENRFSKTYIICITSHDKYMQDAFGHNVIGFVKKSELVTSDRLEELIVRCMDLLQGASKIAYIESNRNDLVVHFFDGSVKTVRGSLEAVAKEMQQYEIYVKCHRSYIVNFNCVKAVMGNFSDFRLLDDTLIPISRGLKREVQRKYDRFIDQRVSLLFGE